MLTIHCHTVQDFLEHLRVSSERWGVSWNSEWIFRGYGDDRWQLLPSALRTPNHPSIQAAINRINNGPLGHWVTPKSEEFLVHMAAEHELLFQFAMASQDSGLPTPEIKTIRPGLDVISKPNHKDLSSFTLDDCELCALAQHHGVPTRLLDWTETGWIAAFFAAKDCFKLQSLDEKDQPKRLAVVAMNSGHLENPAYYKASPYPSHTISPHVKIVRTNRGGNRFLQAQRGLFTYDSHHIKEFFDTRRCSPLEDVLINDETIRKFTLDSRHAGDVLRCLFRERISHHSMMPSYSSAAELAKMIPIWMGPE